MSIFKDTFPEEIKKQIEERQNRLETRSPKDLSYLTSRKAWVRLTSGVNTLEEGGEGTIVPSNKLARQYVLQGGTLYDTTPSDTGSYGGTFRQGIGSDSNKAYSTTTPSGKTHDLGIRPMPGITNVDIKSKSAYGSLREATVNFVCWDIKQLEDLELLYMRPGFTLLLEWGWSPYINNSGSYTTTVSTYDDFLLGTFPSGSSTLQDIYKYLHVTKSLIESNGNYDAMIGYVKNFQWSFRSDGGYDCQTTIISFGEVLESLKINYSVLNIPISEKKNGFLGVGPTISKEISDNFPKVYDKSKLSGILYELAAYLDNDLKNKSSKSAGNDYRNTFIGGSLYNLFALNLRSKSENQSTSDKNGVITLPSSDEYQYYITLGSLCDLLNKYILVSSDKGSIVSVSTKNREYGGSVQNPSTTTPKRETPPQPPPKKQPIPPKSLSERIKEIASSAIGTIGEAAEIAAQAVTAAANEINPNSLDKLNSTSLFCLTHPIQISVDPSICLINSPVWRNGFAFPKTDENVNEATPGAIDANRANGDGNPTLSATARGTVQKVIDYVLVGGQFITGSAYGDNVKIKDEIKKYLDISDATQQEKALQEFIIQYELLRGGKIKKTYVTGNGTVEIETTQGLISSDRTKKYSDTVFPTAGESIRFPSTADFISKMPGVSFSNIFSELNLDDNTKKAYLSYVNKRTFTGVAQTATSRIETNDASEKSAEGSKTNLKFLNDLLPFFKDDNGQSNQSFNNGLGYISNIYININYLYQLSLNQNLESLDKKEKNEINLYDYLKTMMGSVQTSIGNVNNFDVHVDPIDNIGRVIDINFTSENPEDEFDKAVLIEVQGTKTTATNTSLQSQIFPEQSSIVAISAQNGGGTLGLDNNTLVGFNRGIRDRVLPEKYAPRVGIIPSNDINTQLANLKESIGSLATFFNDLRAQYTDSWFSRDIVPSYNSSNAGEYKNALKDIINTIKALSNDPNEFRSIIPTKISLTIDGIGGIVIGNIFRIPEGRLPRGYKGENGVGRKLGYTVTGLSHRIDTKFWETTIDAQTIILEKNTNKNGFNYNNIIIPDPNNPGGVKFQPPVQTSKVGANDYSYSPVAQYYKSKTPPYANGNIPDSELRYLRTDDARSNKIHRLHPTAATQWEKLVVAARNAGFTKDKFHISYIEDKNFPTNSPSAYRLRAQQKPGVGRAEPGSSPHGWGGAVDIQQLVTAQKIAAGIPLTDPAGKAAGAKPAAEVRETNELYKWLAQNGPTYGWYNPYRLADGQGKQDEAWHFEYWGPV